MPFDAMPDAEVIARDRMIRLRDHIATLPPDHFDMREWRCGTAACIGGWAETLFFAKEPRFALSWAQVGAHMGLTKMQASALFFPNGREPYTATPAHAVRVLDHYLATGEVDWGVARASSAMPAETNGSGIPTK